MRSALGMGIAVWLVPGIAAAQQVTVTTPYNSVSDGFFERMGVNWGFNWKGINASFGGANLAVPPFGGFDPSAGMNFGFGSNRPGRSGFFNFFANQGYRQSFTSQAPSVTLFNGQRGFFSDTSQSPFVIGQIPVVGGFPVVPYAVPVMPHPGFSMSAPAGVLPATNPRNPRVQAMRQQLAQRRQPAAADLGGMARNPPAAADAQAGDLNLAAPRGVAAQAGSAQRKLAAAQASSAGRAVPSVAEARRLHRSEQNAQNDEARVLLERGLTAEEDGKANVAKIYYRMALKRAAGQLQQQVQARLDALDSSSNP